jgi:hypothetical protein
MDVDHALPGDSQVSEHDNTGFPALAPQYPQGTARNAASSRGVALALLDMGGLAALPPRSGDGPPRTTRTPVDGNHDVERGRGVAAVLRLS